MYAGSAPPPAPYSQPRAADGPGFVGIALAVIGAVLGVIAFTAVDWFESGPSHFSDVHDAVNQLDKQGFATGIGKVYFGWLAWVLLAVAVIFAIVANLPTPASGAMRTLGALVGLAGIGLTLWAVEFAHGPAYTQFLKHSRIGFYLTLAAFLLTTIGSLIGPARRTRVA
jgi:hypothetical protein